MNRALAMLIIGLVFGGGIGFVIAAANGVTLDGHDHATDHGPAQDHANHAAHHDMPLVLAAENAPTLDLEIFPDPSAGWNLHIQTTGFTFAPQNASRDHIDGEGHAHVYINGVKLGRVYADWVHLELPEGGAEVKVTLNSNDHRPLAVGDARIEASVVVSGG